MHPVPFGVVTESRPEGIGVLAVRGELDLNTAPRLEEELRAALDGARSLVVNLADCEFIDSTGVALLVKTWQGLGDGSGSRRLVLCCPSRQVRRLFEITGLEEQIEIRTDLESAVESAAAGASTETG